MLEIPAFIKEFLLSVSHTETVLIQEILITETQLHQDQRKKYVEYYTVLKKCKIWICWKEWKNIDLFSRGAEDAEMSVDFRACVGLHLAAHSLRNSLCVEKQLAFPL